MESWYRLPVRTRVILGALFAAAVVLLLSMLPVWDRFNQTVPATVAGKEYFPAHEETYQDNTCGFAYDGSGYGCGGLRFGGPDRIRRVPARYVLELELACGKHRTVQVGKEIYDQVSIGVPIDYQLFWNPCP